MADNERLGYIFDNHKKLVQELYSILDQAAVEYDDSEDVVDDFTAYLKEWARQRAADALQAYNASAHIPENATFDPAGPPYFGETLPDANQISWSAPATDHEEG